MQAAPPGLSIYETRSKGPVRVTYGARQIALGRSVLLIGLADGVLPSSPLARRLEREAEVLADLDHPNISRLFDLIDDENRLWLVLEDVDGPSFSDLAPRDLSWQAIAAIGLDLARALNHAHTQGHIHGKMRAEHVRLTRGGRTKLSGFGEHAPSTDQEVEALEPTDVGGLSPEASIGHPIGPLSDVFCWGALLYELLAGAKPFGDPHENQYATRVRNESPRPLIGSRPQVPRRLELLVAQCLAKIPSERPESASVLAQLIEDMIGSTTLPILHAELSRLGLSDGKSLPLPPVLKTPTARKDKPLALLLAIAVVVGGVTGAGLIFWRNSQDLETPVVVSSRELPSEEALLLRVVASPWAHVLVDGTHRETTPFAEPIALSPGRHTVRLEHPHAAPEERIVEGRAGQSVLLNVQMHVKRPLNLEPVLEAPEEDSP